MSFSGGVFSINTTGQPVVAGTTISASVFNALTADLATGLSTCILKDGTQTTTAVIPFAQGINVSGGTLVGTASMLSPIANALSGNVALNNTANYFDGPSVAQGTSGTWIAFGQVTVGGGSASVMEIKLWDGTTVLATTTIESYASGNGYAVAISGGPITNPAGNIRISVRDLSNTNNSILFNERSQTKSSTITAVRIG